MNEKANFLCVSVFVWQQDDSKTRSVRDDPRDLSSNPGILQQSGKSVGAVQQRITAEITDLGMSVRLRSVKA